MKYQYWLSNIEGIGSGKIGYLLNCCSGAEEVYHLSEEQLGSVFGLNARDAGIIAASRRGWDVEGEYERFLTRGIRFLTTESEEYPPMLRDIHNPPYSLYVKGHMPHEDKNVKNVAIVGARMCSEYGRAMANEIAYYLGQNHIGVISGMAKGVDSCGHQGALRAGGSTYAVLGCGIDICYPASNYELYKEIAGHGGIICEYPPGTEPCPGLFPMRNRIISGMSDVVVVVEAKIKSGSLITADYALEQGKDIYAVPGRISDSLSGGCNRLIRQGAGMILSAKDFIHDLDVFVEKLSTKNVIAKNSLEKEELLVYSVLDLQPKSMDELIKATNLSITRLVAILASLQHRGFAQEVFKNYYIGNYG